MCHAQAEADAAAKQEELRSALADNERIQQEAAAAREAADDEAKRRAEDEEAARGTADEVSTALRAAQEELRRAREEAEAAKRAAKDDAERLEAEKAMLLSNAAAAEAARLEEQEREAQRVLKEMEEAREVNCRRRVCGCRVCSLTYGFFQWFCAFHPHAQAAEREAELRRQAEADAEAARAAAAAEVEARQRAEMATDDALKKVAAVRVNVCAYVVGGCKPVFHALGCVLTVLGPGRNCRGGSKETCRSRHYRCGGASRRGGRCVGAGRRK